MRLLYILAILSVFGILFLAGCCGAAGPSSAAASKTDPYQKFYGQKADVSSTYTVQFDKYSEQLRSDGTKTVTITLTASNSGTEESSVENAIFISDDKGRNFEANPFLCSTLINPGLSKSIDCEFFDIPPDAKIVALKLGDSIGTKGKYTTLMTWQ